MTKECRTVKRVQNINTTKERDKMQHEAIKYKYTEHRQEIMFPKVITQIKAQYSFH